MNRLIGGLLVVSLLSRPTYAKTERYAYDFFAQKTQIVYVYKRKDEDELGEKDSIGDILNQMAENTRYIAVLLKEKTKVFDKIQATMDLFAYRKMKLNETQMGAFAQMTHKQEYLEQQLQCSFQYIDEKKQLQAVKKELFRTQCDCALVVAKLKELVQEQFKAIEILKEMITGATAAVAVMCAA